MYLRQKHLAARPVTEARHFRLFELMRQSQAYVGQNRNAHASDSAAINAFRDMACASLRA